MNTTAVGLLLQLYFGLTGCDEASQCSDFNHTHFGDGARFPETVIQQTVASTCDCNLVILSVAQEYRYKCIETFQVSILFLFFLDTCTLTLTNKYLTLLGTRTNVLIEQKNMPSSHFTCVLANSKTVMKTTWSELEQLSENATDSQHNTQHGQAIQKPLCAFSPSGEYSVPLIQYQ